MYKYLLIFGWLMFKQVHGLKTIYVLVKKNVRIIGNDKNLINHNHMYVIRPKVKIVGMNLIHKTICSSVLAQSSVTLGTQMNKELQYKD